MQRKHVQTLTFFLYDVHEQSFEYRLTIYLHTTHIHKKNLNYTFSKYNAHFILSTLLIKEQLLVQVVYEHCRDWERLP